VDIKDLLEVVAESVEVQRSFFEKEASRVVEAGHMMADALRSGHKILAFGNGGSAADAQHFSSELVNRYVEDRPALAAIALTTDTSTLTSVANDTHYRYVFARQVEALGGKGDVALAISTSGSSENVLEAVKVGRSRGAHTIGLSGRDGGDLVSLVDLSLVVPHTETARIQEVHGLVVHLFCQIIEDELYPKER
jgi:D-sedoheptulose 7-phosphate isomerase